MGFADVLAWVFPFLNVASTVSLSMTILGLVSVLIGSATWACHAPLAYFASGRSFRSDTGSRPCRGCPDQYPWVDRNPHVCSPRGAPVGCALILVIAAVRFALSSPRELTRTRDFLLYCAIGISITALAHRLRYPPRDRSLAPLIGEPQACLPTHVTELSSFTPIRVSFPHPPKSCGFLGIRHEEAIGHHPELRSARRLQSPTSRCLPKRCEGTSRLEFQSRR